MKRCSAFSNMYVDAFQTSLAVLNLLVRPPAFAVAPTRFGIYSQVADLESGFRNVLDG